jgi:hypothetical protein
VWVYWSGGRDAVQGNDTADNSKWWACAMEHQGRWDKNHPWVVSHPKIPISECELFSSINDFFEKISFDLS